MKKVLIIENLNSFSEEVILYLQLKEYAVLQAYTEEDALAIAAEEVPDIIFCLCNITGIDGFNILGNLKKEKSFANIPFIFLTASAEENFIEKLKTSKADSFLVKPFQLEELERLLKLYLE